MGPLFIYSFLDILWAFSPYWQQSHKRAHSKCSPWVPTTMGSIWSLWGSYPGEVSSWNNTKHHRPMWSKLARKNLKISWLPSCPSREQSWKLPCSIPTTQQDHILLSKKEKLWNFLVATPPRNKTECSRLLPRPRTFTFCSLGGFYFFKTKKPASSKNYLKIKIHHYWWIFMTFI